MNRRIKIIATQPQPIRSLAQLAGRLRHTVAARLMREFGLRVPPPLIRRALDEAMEVARDTGFPHLFFPALAEEKARFVSAALGEHFHDQTARNFRHAA